MRQGRGFGLAPVAFTDWRSLVVDRRDLSQFVETVTSFDESYRSRQRPHDETLSGGTTGVEAHAVQQFTVGHAGGGEEAVVSANQIVGGEHAIEVVALGDRGISLGLVSSPQLALDLAPHAFEGSGGCDTLGRAADTEENVDAGVGPGGGNGSEDVAVADELDTSS